MYEARPAQASVLAYSGGKMGVSAVPGSGKTWTLSALAARLVAEGGMRDDQEVLIVTLVNSAVDNFRRRVNEFVKTRGFLPGAGYCVRTLHGLAYDIVRERPDLVRLADDFRIVDETEAGRILRDAVAAWIGEHPGSGDEFFDPELNENKLQWVRREKWPELIAGMAGNFVRQAKDLRADPALLRQRLDAVRAEPMPSAEAGLPLPLLEMGVDIYEDYQRSLAYRGGVDFQDLIRHALQALELDGDYLARLRDRWPYVLEDEAQDSSELQEKILEQLAGPDDNWVRVGDPNQAIFETFTTASPEHLRRFLRAPGVVARALPNSGRSTQSIMDLANFLVNWTREGHPVVGVREALAPPLIEPAPPGDPQPNPPDEPTQVRLIETNYDPNREIDVVVRSLVSWLPEHPDATVAVLAPRNDRGDEFVVALKAREIPTVELLRTTAATREAATALGAILHHLADPLAPLRLAAVFAAIPGPGPGDDEAKRRHESVRKVLARIAQAEDFLWPGPEREPLDSIDRRSLDADATGQLLGFRASVCRWHSAVLLPVDQLILTLAADLFERPADLALAYKLAITLKQSSDLHPDWRLAEMANEIDLVARNERKFLGFSDDDTGFDPEQHRGKVVVATYHKAKGLEWDRVYLTSANTYDFPSALAGDTFISEKWFVRDGLNLEAEALEQLRALVAGDTGRLAASPGGATGQSRLDYVSERLRLLYVGITRARRELVITWNTGRGANDQRAGPAAPVVALMEFWKARAGGS